MADYTLILLILTAYIMNYLLMYRKNRTFHALLFIAISTASFYVTRINTNYKNYTTIPMVMILLGIVNFIYDVLFPSKKNQ